MRIDWMVRSETDNIETNTNAKHSEKYKMRGWGSDWARWVCISSVRVSAKALKCDRFALFIGTAAKKSNETLRRKEIGGKMLVTYTYCVSLATPIHWFVACWITGDVRLCVEWKPTKVRRDEFHLNIPGLCAHFCSDNERGLASEGIFRFARLWPFSFIRQMSAESSIDFENFLWMPH